MAASRCMCGRSEGAEERPLAAAPSTAFASTRMTTRCPWLWRERAAQHWSTSAFWGDQRSQIGDRVCDRTKAWRQDQQSRYLVPCSKPRQGCHL